MKKEKQKWIAAEYEHVSAYDHGGGQIELHPFPLQKWERKKCCCDRSGRAISNRLHAKDTIFRLKHNCWIFIQDREMMITILDMEDNIGVCISVRISQYRHNKCAGKIHRYRNASRKFINFQYNECQLSQLLPFPRTKCLNGTTPWLWNQKISQTPI